MTHPPVAPRPRPEWIAHRGAPREAHENTLRAFAVALDRGADAIELDVHATSDGIVVVHHDPVLSRSSDPDHAGAAIHDTEWRTVREIEVGGERIPTLADVLDLVGERAYVYVEIKASHIEALVIATIRESRASCALHSFDHDSIACVAALAPDLPRGILFDDRNTDAITAMRLASARDVWPHWTLIDRDLVRRVHDAGGRVVAWTVNAPADARHLVDLGVDGLCTDDLRPFIKARG